MSEFDTYLAFIDEHFGATRDEISCDLETSLRGMIRHGDEIDVDRLLAHTFKASDGRWYGRWN